MGDALALRIKSLATGVASKHGNGSGDLDLRAGKRRDADVVAHVVGLFEGNVGFVGHGIEQGVGVVDSGDDVLPSGWRSDDEVGNGLGVAGVWGALDLGAQPVEVFQNELVPGRGKG